MPHVVVKGNKIASDRLVDRLRTINNEVLRRKIEIKLEVASKIVAMRQEYFYRIVEVDTIRHD